MNKKIPIPLVILIILLVIAVIVGVALWMCPNNWQTYSNEKYNYEIKYPNGWRLYAPDPDTPSLYGLKNEEIVFFIFNNDEQLSLKEWWDIGGASPRTQTSLNDITLSGKEAIKVDYISSGSQYIEILTAIDSKTILSIEIFMDPGDYLTEEAKQIFDQMLSTFKFLE